MLFVLKLRDIKTSFQKYIDYSWSAVRILLTINIAALPLTFVFPKLYQVLLDDVMAKGKLGKLFQICIGFIALFILQTFLSYIKQIYENKVSKNFNMAVRKDVWCKLLNMSFDQKDHFSIGDAKQRVVDDVEKIGNFIKDQIVDRYYNYFIVILGTILILIISPIMALICSAVLPIILLVNDYIGRKSSEVNGEIREIGDEYYGFCYNSLQFWKEIKLQNVEDSFLKTFAKYRNNLSKLGLKSIKYWGYGEVFNDFKTNYLNKVFVYILGVIFIIKGDLTVGTVVMFAEYYGYCFNALNAIVNKNIEIKKNNPYYSRIIDVLKMDTEEERSDVEIDGDIVVEDLKFAYGSNNVIAGCSFKVNKGDKIAVTGESGCGKSTLIKLMLGMLNADSGEIYYSDKDIKEISLKSLYKQIGVVMQDPIFFDLSIIENLKLASPNATDERIESCCKAACIFDFIESLPNGYGTIIGENGVRLSGGQKQRLAIAQAILKQSEILFLDEATSALDESNEREIMDNIRKNYPEMTVMLVSHKPSVIALLDKRLEINDKQGVLYENT